MVPVTSSKCLDRMEDPANRVLNSLSDNNDDSGLGLDIQKTTVTFAPSVTVSPPTASKSYLPIRDSAPPTNTRASAGVSSSHYCELESSYSIAVPAQPPVKSAHASVGVPSYYPGDLDSSLTTETTLMSPTNQNQDWMVH